MRWTKETQPLRQQIVEFLTSLPNIKDSPGQQAFIYSVGLDPHIESQVPFGISHAQFVQLLVQKLRREDLIAVLEAAKYMIGQNRRYVCETLIQHLRTEVEDELGHGVTEIEPDIDITLRKIEEVEEVTGLRIDEIPEGSIKVTMEDIKKGKNVTGMTIKKV